MATWTAALISDVHCGTTWDTPMNNMKNRLVALDPDVIFVAGDMTVSGGTLQYGVFDDGLSAYKNRMVPVPGNHDWRSGSLANWYTYFKSGCLFNPPSQAAPWGSFDYNGWHIVTANVAEPLNGAYPYGTTSTQYKWIEADLEANKGKPLIGIWHVPRFSKDGSHGDKADVKDLWDLFLSYKADLFVNGHVHQQQRTVPNNGSGTETVGGPLQFTSSGVEYRSGNVASAADPFAYHNAVDLAVVHFTFQDATWSWNFRKVSDNTSQHSGSAAVHNPITNNPTNVTVTPARVACPVAVVRAPTYVTKDSRVTPGTVVGRSTHYTPTLVDTPTTVVSPALIICTSHVASGEDIVIGTPVQPLTVVGIGAIEEPTIIYPPSVVTPDVIEGTAQVTTGDVLSTVTVTPNHIAGSATVPNATAGEVPHNLMLPATVEGTAEIPAGVPAIAEVVVHPLVVSGIGEVHQPTVNDLPATAAPDPVGGWTELFTGDGLDEVIEIDTPIAGTAQVSTGTIIDFKSVHPETVVGTGAVYQPEYSSITLVEPATVTGYAIVHNLLYDEMLPDTVVGTAAIPTPTLSAMEVATGFAKVFPGESLDESIALEAAVVGAGSVYLASAYGSEAEETTVDMGVSVTLTATGFNPTAAATVGQLWPRGGFQ